MFAVVKQYEDGNYGLLNTDTGVIESYTLEELRRQLTRNGIYGFNWQSKKPKVCTDKVVLGQLFSDIRLDRELKGLGMIVKRNAPRALKECVLDASMLGDIATDVVTSVTLNYSNVGRNDKIEIPWGIEAVTATNRDMIFRSEVVEVVLPSTLRVIDRDTFAECRKLQSISIPDSVERIGAYAFSGCVSLKDIKFPCDFDGTGCSEGVFCKCESLTAVDLTGLKRIPNNMFDGCTSLETVIFGKDLVEIGDSAFYNTNLHRVVLPAEGVHIGASAFAECKHLDFVAKNYVSEPNSFIGSGLIV